MLEMLSRQPVMFPCRLTRLTRPASPSPISSFLLSSPRLLYSSFFPRSFFSTVYRPPSAVYDSYVTSNTLRDDPSQRALLSPLDTLYNSLVEYHSLNSPPPSSSSSFSSLLNRFRTPPSLPQPPPGLYIHGDVGSGKTMLMDLFYTSIPSHIPSQRVHFHAFMRDVHAALNLLPPSPDRVRIVASDISRNAQVLCFDEFQVTDIADAMILRSLLDALLATRLVLVLTSNRTPDDLYKNGIQRSSFVPCINLIKSSFVIHDIDSHTDYRKLPRALSKVFYHPIANNTIEFEKLFLSLAPRPILNKTLTVWGRPIHIPRSSDTTAWFTFHDLCAMPLSAADYLEITKTFDTIFISNVPSLTFEQRDLARRFILFIDAAYESRIKLFTLSDVPITQIFSDKSSSTAARNKEVSQHQRLLMEDLNLSVDEIGASSIFTGEDEIFAFARSVSRLSEMGTTFWAESTRSVSKSTLEMYDYRDS